MSVFGPRRLTHTRTHTKCQHACVECATDRKRPSVSERIRALWPSHDPGDVRSHRGRTTRVNSCSRRTDAPVEPFNARGVAADTHVGLVRTRRLVVSENFLEAEKSLYFLVAVITVKIRRLLPTLP